MQIKRVEFSDFRSFSGEHAFSFDRAPGLYLISGRNEVEPELGSNGVGKSTLIDALFWGLFGVSLESLRSSGLKTWKGSKGPQVKVVFSNGDWIRRRLSPNELVLRHGDQERTVTQAELDAFLGINAKEYRHSIITPQDGNSFLSLRSSERLEIVSHVLGLDFWSGCSKIAGQIVIEIGEELDKIKVELSRLAGRLEEAQERERELVGLNQEVQLRRELENLELEQKALARALVRAGRQRSLIESRLDAITQQQKESRERLRALTEERRGLDARMAEHRAQVKSISDEIDRAERARDRLRERVARCPACGQKIGADKHADLLGESISTIRVLAGKRRSLKFAIKELYPRLDRLGLAIDLVERSTREGGADELTAQRAELISEIAAMTTREQAVRESKARIESTLEKISRDIASAKEHLTKLVGRRTILMARSRTLGREMESVAVWVPGFKEIRLMALEDALSVLRAGVLLYLSQVGLGGWDMDFAIEREGQTGAIKNGFHVLIQSPRAPGFVQWEAWSEGEAQRLRLAATMALSAMILDGLGVRTNIEIWDEPCARLSPEGRESVFECLRARAIELGRQVYVIEQGAVDWPFDGVIGISMGPKGSRIENAPILRKVLNRARVSSP